VSSHPFPRSIAKPIAKHRHHEKSCLNVAPIRSSAQRPGAGYDKWWGNDCVFMGILGKDASALQCLTVSTCAAWFGVKLDRQHQSASAHLTDRFGADAA